MKGLSNMIKYSEPIQKTFQVAIFAFLNAVALYRIICTCTVCTYTYIYTLYGIQDPGPCKHVTVYTDPYPVPHETTNTVYH